MQATEIAERLKGAKQLPALSATSQKILKLLGGSNTSVHELAAALAQDPPVAACVLKLANSVAYGGVATTKLPQAIMRIGLNMLRTLVVGNSVLRRVDNVGSSNVFDRKGFWRYCLACGIAARAVAYRGRFELADDAFLAGLLSGIGITVLDTFYPDDLKAAVGAVKKTGDSLTGCVRTATGMSLGQIGATLIEEWALGPRVGRAVAQFDTPEYYEEDASVVKLIDFMLIGSALARAAGLGKPIDTPPAADAPVTPTWVLLNNRTQHALECYELTPEVFAKRVEDLKTDFGIFESLA